MIKRYVKIQLWDRKYNRSMGGYTESFDNFNPTDLFDGADPGDQYMLTLVEMDEEEYKALPEFTGF